MATVCRSTMAPLAGLMLLIFGSMLSHCDAAPPRVALDGMLAWIATNHHLQKQKDANFPCSDRYSGTDTCPEGPLTNRHDCSCHSHCHLFGNCCDNTAPGDGAGNEVLRYTRESYVCYLAHAPKYDARFFHWGVYMVNSCHDGSGDLLTRLCKHPLAGRNMPDAVSTPVSDPNSGVTYHNLYCAVCNGRPPEELAQWHWKYTCPNVRAFSDLVRELVTTEQPTSSRRNQILDRIRSRCQLSYEPPSGAHLQSCVDHLVDDCPNGAGDDITNQTLRSSCRDGPLPIVHTMDGITAFKNRECAACWLVQPQSFSCWRLFGVRYGRIRTGFGFDVTLTPGTSHCSGAVPCKSFKQLFEAVTACSRGQAEGACSAIAACRGLSIKDRGACLALNASLNRIDLRAVAAQDEEAAESVATIVEQHTHVPREFTGSGLNVHYHDGEEVRSLCVQCGVTAKVNDFTLHSNESLGLAGSPHVAHRLFYIASNDSATVGLLRPFRSGTSEVVSSGCAGIQEELLLALLLVSQAVPVVYSLLVVLVGQL